MNMHMSISMRRTTAEPTNKPEVIKARKALSRYLFFR